MIDVYRKYGHRTDLMVMFNCRSNIYSEPLILTMHSGMMMTGTIKGPKAQDPVFFNMQWRFWEFGMVVIGMWG